MRNVLVGGLSLVLVGCHGELDRRPGLTDLADSRAVVAWVASNRALAPHFAAARAKPSRPRGFQVQLGERASDPLRIGADDATWLELALEGAAPIAAEHVNGVRVHPRALPNADVLRLDEGGRIEDLIVLRDPSAASAFRYHVRRGPGLASLRVRDGFVEALDARGVARLRAEPMEAWDALGVRHVVDVRIEGDFLVASLAHAHLPHPVIVDPAWGLTTALAVTRVQHAMVALDKGKQLVIGGIDATNTALSSTEIFDPATLSWTLGKPLSGPRAGSAAVLLKDGRVLVAGGSTGVDASGAVSTVEVWDPTTGLWASKADLPAVKAMGSAVRYDDTHVMFTGVAPDQIQRSPAYVYDVTTDKWRAVSTGLVEYTSGREPMHLLSDGRVMLNSCYRPSAWIYHPGLDTISRAADRPSFDAECDAARLADGRVLYVGTGAYVYSPKTDTWTTLSGVPAAVTSASLLNLADGRLLVVGGRLLGSGGTPITTTNAWDPILDTWTSFGALAEARSKATVAQLPDGAVLAVGGINASLVATRTVDLFGSGLAVGSVCASSGACATGSCVDGACCDRACTGQCESCNQPGNVGKCVFVTGSPPLDRGSCAGTGTCKGTCDGASSTCTFPKTLCTAGSCSGGVETPAANCDGAGSCPAVTSKVCSPYTCGAVACKASCSATADCASGRVCELGKCVSKHDRGEACSAVDGCLSPYVCVDGTCCDKACTGACESCKLAGSLGVCSPIDGALDDEDKCGTGPCVDVCRAGKCSFKNGASTCAAASCVAGVLSTGGSCDGTGPTCTGASSSTSCPGLVKCQDDKTCRSSKCGADDDCAGGRRCDLVTSTCTLPPLADAGTSSDATTSDATTSDAIASDSAPETAVAEAGAPDPGPKPTIGSEFKRCTKGSECPTGHCVEGVCCNTACTDRCSSCAMLATPGACTPEPIGVDLKSECGPALSCLGTCDGAGACIGAGKGTMCGRNRCTGPTVGVGPAFCAAAGATCPTDDAVKFDCAPYNCEPAFGACVTTCKSSEDCARGFSCDLATRACVALGQAAPEEDSGCTLAAPSPGEHSQTGAGWMLLALALIRRVAQGRPGRRRTSPRSP